MRSGLPLKALMAGLFKQWACTFHWPPSQRAKFAISQCSSTALTSSGFLLGNLMGLPRLLSHAARFSALCLHGLSPSSFVRPAKAQGATACLQGHALAVESTMQALPLVRSRPRAWGSCCRSQLSVLDNEWQLLGDAQHSICRACSQGVGLPD